MAVGDYNPTTFLCRFHGSFFLLARGSIGAKKGYDDEREIISATIPSYKEMSLEGNRAYCGYVDLYDFESVGNAIEGGYLIERP